MKKKIKAFLILATFLCLIPRIVKAQDTLPSFTIRDLGKGKTQISWINPFQSCIQLMVQRSYDSTRFFRTIFSAQSPQLPQNGLIDNDAVQGMRVFYRIFYVLEGGAYFFSPSQSPGNFNLQTNSSARNRYDSLLTSPPKPGEIKFVTVYRQTKDSILLRLEYNDFRKFRDSILTKTKDTLFAVSPDEIMFRVYVPKYLWKPSPYVFTSNNGYVNISLPLLKQHRYRIIFFEEDGTEIFQIKQVKEAELILDKTNFIHAGWFSFELFEDDKLKEKNRFYLEKDF